MKTLFVLCALLISAQLSAADAPSKEDYNRLATELEAHLETHILNPWFPRAVDKERGGFIQDYAEDWSEKRDGNKTLVYQARLTWMAAQVALSFPEKAKEYIEYSNHGLDFLADKMWDKENGGFFWSVDAAGKATGERGNEKHAYGISFGLYAASVNYKATKNPKALELAEKTSNWLNEHAHDSKFSGYFEALTVKGEPILHPEAGPNAPLTDLIGTQYGMKSMNTHIHLLESLTAFAEVVPDQRARQQREEVFLLVLTRICVQPGAMHLFYNPDWTPVPDLDSFGHDIETAYLLMEAADTLKMPDKKTGMMSRALLDHALEFGWDKERGGFYNEGSTFRKVFDKEKVWWVQAEGLNALLLMHDTHGGTTPKYWQAFLKEWEFIRKYQVDAKNKGWISYLNEDGTPARPGQMKSDQWKEPYHQGRAVINVIERLRKMGK